MLPVYFRCTIPCNARCYSNVATSYTGTKACAVKEIGSLGHRKDNEMVAMLLMREKDKQGHYICTIRRYSFESNE